MSLTADQKAKMKQILVTYRRDVHALVKKHKTSIANAVAEMDKKKAAEIRKMIG